ncbi:MAG: T9SS type A sorting domain-containing protein [Bacteroidales bacterium]|nr:T9SS type A sorting domain-containing protein [Bacteroidales bacterium]
MKKVFLLSLGLILGASAFAQKPVVKDTKVAHQANLKEMSVGNDINNTPATFSAMNKSVVVRTSYEVTNAETMWTNYDLQSNGFVSNRMYQLPNGSVAVAATMSHEANQSATDRGTGYNFCANGDNEGGWGEQPDERVEGATRTGWPSIARYGANGEILAVHNDGVYVFYRETAGQGEWIPVNGTGKLPVQVPAGYTNAAEPSWPRIATSGDNHNIVHIVADIQFSGTTTTQTQIVFRSEDLVNWTCNYSPLADYDAAEGIYSADDYAIAANGNTVAILYTGSVTGGTEMFKSTDNGLTWERTMIWENPYYGLDWETDPASVFTDTLFGANNGSICIDNDGIAHVAINCFEFLHSDNTTSYTYWSGLSVDGIAYWNETMEAPIQSIDGNPHHALRLWWDAGDGYIGHIEDDSIRFCGWIQPDPETYWNEFSNDMFYHENDYSNHWMGLSASPAIAVDPAGNLAVAYSVPTIGDGDGTYYYRQAYVSTKQAGEEKWNVAQYNLQEDFMLSMSEGIWTNAVSNPVHENEFWFSFQMDDVIGLYWGTDATQTMASENYIQVAKIFNADGVEENESIDVVYNIYPNPATDYVVVESSMNADATITFINLAGQTVKSFNRSLTVGANHISIDLESGVYFCTVNANGFNKTTKVVVK